MTNTQNDPYGKEELHQQALSGLMPLFTWQGRDVYPLAGAEGDDGDTDDQDGESGEGAAEEDGAGETGTGAETVSREDFDKLRNQLSANDKARAALEKKLKEQEDAKKDELTKATERVAELEKAQAASAKELSDLRLQNAFLSSNTGITWHDPEDALDIAQRRGYLAEVVGEDGKVDGAKLTAKLKELAKAKPNLVKSSGDNHDSGPSSTGTKVGSKGSTGSKGSDKIPSRYDKFLNR